jgi:hypothetical protein
VQHLKQFLVSLTHENKNCKSVLFYQNFTNLKQTKSATLERENPGEDEVKKKRITSK